VLVRGSPSNGAEKRELQCVWILRDLVDPSDRDYEVRRRNMKKCVLVTHAVLLSMALCAGHLQAELVSAGTTKTVLENCDAADAIRSDLVSKGLLPTVASDLVEQMGADEISYFSEESDRTQAGGDASGGVVTVLVIVLLVVAIVYFVNRS